MKIEVINLIWYKLSKLKNEGKLLYVSFFVLYEFKTGFIKDLIDFYYEAKLYGPSKAMLKWSDTRGRSPKNFTMLSGLIAEKYDSINTSNSDKFLRQVEWVIFDCLTNFYTLIEKYPVGDFGSDEIINCEIKGRSDYKNFRDMYNNRECIPLDIFWKKYKEELNLLLSDKQFGKKYKKMHRKLLQINKDFNKANNYRINKGVGDAVISVDCPKTFTINSLDKSFEFLCPAIGKKVEIIKKFPFSIRKVKT